MHQAAVVTWNWMGGEIRWDAFGVIAELLGVDDVEQLIRSVLHIREQMHCQS